MGRDHLDAELSKPLDRGKEIALEPSALAAKMANSISESNRRHKTYAPAPVAVLRDADAARKLARRKLNRTKICGRVRGGLPASEVDLGFKIDV